MKVTPENPIRLTPSSRISEERYRLLVEAVTDYAIVLLDPHGVISSWNCGAEHIHGFTAEESIGRYFSCLYPRESIELGKPEHELMIAKSKSRFQDEAWRLRKDGSRFWASVMLTALYDERGELWGYSSIVQDLTERRVYEESLRQSEERFRLLVEGVKDCAIFLLDPQGIVSSWNTGAEAIKGYRAEEIIGHHFSRFYPQEAIDRRWPDYELEVATAEGSFEDEGWRLRKDGTRFWANVLITALHDSHGELYGFAKVTRDLTERKRIEVLELAEQRTTEFLAMLSHELRNPLAPMRSALSIMKTAAVDDPVHVGSRQVLERQVAQISRIVDDLLEVSRVTAGTINLQQQVIILQDVIASAVEATAPLIEARRHRLEQRLPDEPVTVEGDAMRLTQVLVNILTNAAQYTPEGGDVRIALDTSLGRARIRIADTGEGIERHRLKDLFGLFVQGERGLDRSGGGLGVGLTLARRLVEMQGGVIRAVSDGPNQGSEFVVELPLVAEVSGDVAAEVPADAPAGTTSGSDEAANTMEQRSLNILLVEDMPDVAEGMEMILRLWGHQVQVLGDGKKALDVCMHTRPDVLLLDIGLPGMSGYELASRLRAMPEFDQTPLIALTGYGQKKDRDRAYASGFDHHLVKGDSLDGLENLLNEFVEQRCLSD